MPRADRRLVELGLAASRTAAQALIAAGRALVDGAAIAKASQMVPENARIEVKPGPEDRYVSRGGLKLAGALTRLGLDVRGVLAVDVGQSTGGFTDCLLQAGARRVIGLDVGHGQLAPRLTADPRVVLIEGVNARHVTRALVAPHVDGEIDLVVGDVSFISLTLILAAVATLPREGGTILFLVKPQFEVGREGLGKGGIVKDETLLPEVERKIRAAAEHAGLDVLDYFDSPIRGGDGNREQFIYARRRVTASGTR